MSHPNQSFAVTGIGLLSALGATLDEIWSAIGENKSLPMGADYSLKLTNVAPYLKDRRMLKAVSQRDGVGLAAIEQLKRQINFDGLKADSFRRGMYVGACPSTVDDNDNYLEAVVRSKNEFAGERAFGTYCMDARPTTLLMGLPNNVLCYGAIILDAKGPNNNFTSGEISALVSIHAALRNLRRSRIDFAVCGGYSSQTNPYSLQVIRGRGDLHAEYDAPALTQRSGASGTVPADAAVFVSIETEELASSRNLKPLATIRGSALASNSAGPGDLNRQPNDAKIIYRMMRSCMQDAGIEAESLDMVFVSGAGIERIDAAEKDAAMQLTKDAGHAIPVVSVGTITKNMFEASGLIEIGVAQKILQTGHIPSPIGIDGFASSEFSQKKSIRGMVVRASGFGEYAAMIFEVTGG
jgi:3-oxoacyl-[acyl-carrier-protein] synthase II